MKKIVYLLVAALMLGLITLPAAAADIKFKDVPDTHWAAKSVYDLVKEGVTQGYPDGTFRGKKNISRYEVAILMDKLSKVVDSKIAAGSPDLQGLLEKMKAELAKLEAARISAGGAVVTGSLEGRYQIGNLLTRTGSPPIGPRVDYRLITTVAKSLGEGTGVMFNIDTMDSGFDTTVDRDRIATLLDAAMTTKLNIGLERPLDVKITAGPGPVTHTYTNDRVLPYQNGLVYLRPRNAINLATAIGGVDLIAKYVARGVGDPASSTKPGEITVNQISGGLGFTWTGLPWLGDTTATAVADYLAKDPSATPKGPTHLRGQIEVKTRPAESLLLEGKLGVAGRDQEGMAVGAKLVLNDYFKTGTIVKVAASKVGTTFRKAALDEEDMWDYSIYSKPIADGTMNLGIEGVQTVASGLNIIGKLDVVAQGWSNIGSSYPNSSLTAEGGITYDLAPGATVDATYLMYKQYSSNASDAAKLGLRYSF